MSFFLEALERAINWMMHGASVLLTLHYYGVV